MQALTMDAPARAVWLPAATFAWSRAARPGSPVTKASLLTRHQLLPGGPRRARDQVAQGGATHTHITAWLAIHPLIRLMTTPRVTSNSLPNLISKDMTPKPCRFQEALSRPEPEKISRQTWQRRRRAALHAVRKWACRRRRVLTGLKGGCGGRGGRRGREGGLSWRSPPACPPSRAP